MKTYKITTENHDADGEYSERIVCYNTAILFNILNNINIELQKMDILGRLDREKVEELLDEQRAYSSAIRQLNPTFSKWDLRTTWDLTAFKRENKLDDVLS